MKKSKIIQIIIIIVLAIILSILVKITIETINENAIPQINSQDEKKFDKNSTIEYSGNTEIIEDTIIEGGEYISEKTDENAILATGDINATISNISVTKTGDSDGADNTSFYGINSGIIAKSGAKVTLKDIIVTTDATGANGVFCYGGSATTKNSSTDGTNIQISDSKITTSKDNSGGIMTTGGGTLNALNLIVNTSGVSSAAIRTDRGGGTVTVEGGKYTTTGAGSPSIYSTANVTVNNSELISEASEGVVIEGKNSVIINNCKLTDNNTKLNGLSTTYKNIFLYQSMSGDADTGNSEFTANNSTITTNKGDSFYITNTESTINLTNNTIINNDKTGNFLRAKADSWGKSRNNGGNVTLILNNQRVIGDIVIDSISKLNMNIKENSYYEGKINTENTANNIILKIDGSSKIKLTGDSYVTSIETDDTTYSNIDFNGYKLYVNGTKIK